MDSLQPTWRTRLHVYSHWHRAPPLDLMVRVPAKIGGECLLWVIADISVAKSDVRFTPESGHVRCSSPLWVKSGHQVQIDRVRLVFRITGSMTGCCRRDP